MAHHFFDGSALVKRYVNKTDSTRVENIIDPNTGTHIYVAAITCVEVVMAHPKAET